MRLINCIQSYPRTFLLVMVVIFAITLIVGLFAGFKIGVDTALKKDEEFLQAYFGREDTE